MVSYDFGHVEGGRGKRVHKTDEKASTSCNWRWRKEALDPNAGGVWQRGCAAETDRVPGVLGSTNACSWQSGRCATSAQRDG